VLAMGQKIPDVALWTAPGERIPLANLLSRGRALLLFYLFDWSST
jgi:peroxiredoxin